MLSAATKARQNLDLATSPTKLPPAPPKGGVLIASQYGPTYVLGIDPGVKGAMVLVRYNPANRSSTIEGVHEIPTRSASLSKSTYRKEVDAAALSSLMRVLSTVVDKCYLEDVHSLPRDGHVGAFSFGQTKGIIRGVLASCYIDCALVSPSVWKLALGLSSDKNSSLNLARKIWRDNEFGNNDNMAEAALLALYGVTHIGTG